jgi:hypothetical protein
MHPEFLRVLATARRQDLLDRRGHWGQAQLKQRSTHSTGSTSQPLLARSRQRAGSLLIRAGGRLLGDQRAALELVHE